MLKDEARKYIDSELQYGDKKDMYHYNCSEIILNACNDYYKLGLDSKALKMIVPFGGGLNSEKNCGILTGGVSAIGIMFAEDKPSLNTKMKEVTIEWVKTFENEFGSADCKIIKETKRDEVKGCEPLIIKGSEILEEVLSEQYKK
ncbi:C-GCAxxG-C-C family protein [Clostridium sp. D2Q-11]|uniref:C-GCAxxG-C-C family protein n=1 Tax=Anaeromonas frigoriresistens TaxID=2683708 RepID=A0A942Z7D1_9FIRM|nr:C-GCAxxG-C-C family (seleno)protein [Anaeromonas frigoriresistens]MBS4539436.1 C-GCAxxG-C-C family protein [Anaeromonas frigoriresistens]